jgi:hypothetical protein
MQLKQCFRTTSFRRDCLAELECRQSSNANAAQGEIPGREAAEPVPPSGEVETASENQ